MQTTRLSFEEVAATEFSFNRNRAGRGRASPQSVQGEGTAIPYAFEWESSQVVLAGTCLSVMMIGDEA
jgi:hypothetical protein